MTCPDVPRGCDFRPNGWDLAYLNLKINRIQSLKKKKTQETLENVISRIYYFWRITKRSFHKTFQWN